MKYHVAPLSFLFAVAGSFAHEHESEAAKSLDSWASVPVITHWGNAAVYAHAFFMSLATLVLLPAGKGRALDDLRHRACRVQFISRAV
jgi:hypothetical protein